MTAGLPGVNVPRRTVGAGGRRRLVGDEAFFTGLRAFYAEHRYRKAGTGDLQQAMEAASGRRLERFFERWVLDTALPRVRSIRPAFELHYPHMVRRLELEAHAELRRRS